MVPYGFYFSEGNVDWKDFGVKWQNVQAYFDENGVRGCLSTDAGSKLLRRLLAYFDCEEDFKQINFDDDKDNWRSLVLLNNKLTSKVHSLLMDNDIENFDFSNLIFRLIWSTP